MKGEIKAVFFDLDHTIWDLEKNAEETLKELFYELDFKQYTEFTASDFVKSFSRINKEQWALYDKKLIDKQSLRENRFMLAMTEVCIPSENQPKDMWSYFLERCPKQSNLLPNAKEILELLSVSYPIYVITNGFSETQRKKLESAKLSHLFRDVIISEEVGFAKPQKEIFDFARNSANVLSSQAIMVGDSFEADVLGSKNAGWHSVYFNPYADLFTPHKGIIEIKNLLELKEIL